MGKKEIQKEGGYVIEIKFNRVPCIYWSDVQKCNYLQRYILIHSIIYYLLNSSTISDKQFDTVCKQLVKLSKTTENYSKTEYYSVFKGFTGVTGFDLYYKLNKQDQQYLLGIATHVLKLKEGFS